MKSKIDLIALGVPHSQSSTRRANIVLVFADFFFTGATDFADKEGLLFASDEGSTIFIIIFFLQIQCIVSCPDISDSLPGVHDNYNILWLLCGSGDNAGHVSVVKVSLATPPQVVESFHVCESSILCGAYMERTCGEEKKFKGTVSGRFGFPFPTVWLGTQGGRYGQGPLLSVRLGSLFEVSAYLSFLTKNCIVSLFLSLMRR